MDEQTEAFSKEGKYLTFSLGTEQYGLGILKIKEIIGMMPITALPQAPDYLKGVINLRGKVIPIVDLRIKFAMPAQAETERTCIIVVEVARHGTHCLTGLVVDAVSEVLNIKSEQIEEHSSLGDLHSESVLGLAKVESGVKILLDIDQVINSETSAALQLAA
ncbi:MAG: purine-binding chemotaxis protein CheW [Desulfurivibrio sp.]|nr:purine-binding chemotaxis protein CheW [Desulfurivibrio sp.]MBU4117184.1 chemotaxis protein CheW [Pseudomonadota bacterium]